MRREDLWTGLIRLHILHHASAGEVFGLGVIRELRRHGYDLSPGTIYPLLHRMERAGYLVSRERRSGPTARRSYRSTRAGRLALAEARKKVRELFAELVESGEGPVRPGRRR